MSLWLCLLVALSGGAGRSVCVCLPVCSVMSCVAVRMWSRPACLPAQLMHCCKIMMTKGWGHMIVACRVQFSPWETLQTTVGVTVKGAEVTDVYGKTFPTYVNTSTIDHRYPYQTLSLHPCPFACYHAAELPAPAICGTWCPSG